MTFENQAVINNIRTNYHCQASNSTQNKRSTHSRLILSEESINLTQLEIANHHFICTHTTTSKNQANAFFSIYMTEQY